MIEQEIASVETESHSTQKANKMSLEEDILKASNGDILVPNNNLYPTEIDINASKVICTLITLGI